MEGKGDHLPGFRSDQGILQALNPDISTPGRCGRLRNVNQVAGTENILPSAVGDHKGLIAPGRKLRQINAADPNFSWEEGEIGGRKASRPIPRCIH
jgi:hypothetical protein